MRGVSYSDPLRFNASCCPEKNGQHPILEEGEMALMALKNITWSERATFLLLITGVQLKGVLYNPTAHNILLLPREGGATSTNPRRVARGGCSYPNLRRPLWSHARYLSKTARMLPCLWRKNHDRGLGRLPATVDVRA